ncbi:thiamine phosphate synthase [Cryomorphaceae bacterium 1068]|nr:thiamine phosphate synthase [Cryomorphaceae bacterium 1068]
MKIVVVSSPKDQPDEIVEVIRMFEAGLEHFHIRKPRLNRKELTEYIKLFPEKYRKRLVIHSYHGLAASLKLGGIHLSRKHRKRGKFYGFRLYLKRKFDKNLLVTRTFHKLTDITNEKRKYSYTFLSPVFDSITHSTLSGGFSKRALLIMIPQARQPVFALGGVDAERIPEIADLGFEGAVLLGSVWNSEEAPHIVFKKALEAADAF